MDKARVISQSVWVYFALFIGAVCFFSKVFRLLFQLNIYENEYFKLVNELSLNVFQLSKQFYLINRIINYMENMNFFSSPREILNNSDNDSRDDDVWELLVR